MTEDTLHSLFEMIRNLTDEFDQLSNKLASHIRVEEANDKVVNQQMMEGTGRFKILQEQIERNAELSGTRHQKTCAVIEELAVAVKVLSDNIQHEAPCEHLKKAIPKEDFVGHCIDHTEVSEAKKESADMIKAVKRELAKWAAIGISSFVLYAIWHDVLRAVSK